MPASISENSAAAATSAVIPGRLRGPVTSRLFQQVRGSQPAPHALAAQPRIGGQARLVGRIVLPADQRLEGAAAGGGDALSLPPDEKAPHRPFAHSDPGQAPPPQPPTVRARGP